jgi:hypothetical protein
VVDSWSDASQQLTSTWFRMMKELQPLSWIGLPSGGSTGFVGNAPGLEMMQEMMRNSLKLQAAWASLLMPGMAAGEAGAGLQEAGREKLDRRSTPRKPAETEQAA